MATVEQTWMKVQRLLTGPMDLRIHVSADKMQVRFEQVSTVANIRVQDWGTAPDGSPETLVHIWSPILTEVKPSPELYKWVATEGGTRWFGHVRVIPGDAPDGDVQLVMEHAILGDFLDQRELEAALFGVLTSADKLDDELQSRFGGSRWADE